MIEIFQDEAGEWRFRIKGRNGEIMATSEGYAREADALRGYSDLSRFILGAVNIQPVRVER